MMVSPDQYKRLVQMFVELREKAGDDTHQTLLEWTREDDEVFDAIQTYVNLSAPTAAQTLAVVPHLCRVALLFRQ